MLKIQNTQRLDLGVMGENRSRAIEIDCSIWKEMFPNGSISVYHQRPGDTAPDVTGATYDYETGILRWEPTSTDTYIDGEGMAEIRLYENGIIKKTRRIVTLIHHAVVNPQGGTVESNQQAYLNAADAIRAAIETAGATNLAAIIEAGEAKIEAIEEKGQRTIESIPDDYTQLSSDVRTLEIITKLQAENIPGTTQTIVFDGEGNIQKIVHSMNGAAVRTDEFTFESDTIREERTLSTGDKMIIETNTETLTTTVTYVAG